MGRLLGVVGYRFAYPAYPAGPAGIPSLRCLRRNDGWGMDESALDDVPIECFDGAAVIPQPANRISRWGLCRVYFGVSVLKRSRTGHDPHFDIVTMLCFRVDHANDAPPEIRACSDVKFVAGSMKAPPRRMNARHVAPPPTGFARWIRPKSG